MWKDRQLGHLYHDSKRNKGKNFQTHAIKADIQLFIPEANKSQIMDDQTLVQDVKSFQLSYFFQDLNLVI